MPDMRATETRSIKIMSKKHENRKPMKAEITVEDVTGDLFMTQYVGKGGDDTYEFEYVTSLGGDPMVWVRKKGASGKMIKLRITAGELVNVMVNAAKENGMLELLEEEGSE